MKTDISFKTPAWLAGVLLMATACSDYLEHTPDQRTELDTPEKVAELVASAYPKANYITFMEAMTDNAEDKNLNSSDLVNREPWFFNDVPDRGEDTPDFYWLAAYNAIASANHALEVIDAASDDTPYRASKGEALVARAYAHFMLVTLFARAYDPATAATDPGIPYVKDTEKVVTKKYERGTVAYVYQQIEQDLEEGIPLIDNSSYKEGAASYHFTTRAAHAFATRFYLFKKDYDKVIEHANAVFTSDVVTYLRPWNTTYAAYSFNDLAVAYTNSSQPANLLLSETLSSWARSFYVYRYSTGATKFINMMSDNPTGAQYAFSGRYSSTGVYFVFKFREHFVQTGVNSNTGYPYTIVPLFTAEEVLFNRAEARIMKGSYTDGLNDLNMWISTRVVNYNDMDGLWMDKLSEYYSDKKTSQAIALAAVLDLKRVEFLHEGVRWFDILRHNLEVSHTVTGGKPVVLKANDLRRVLQIPREAVATAGLSPNPR